MAKRNDFLTGFLQGLYQSGIGNPAMHEQQRQSNLDTAFKQQELNAKMGESGMIPATPPDTGGSFSKDHPVMSKVLGLMHDSIVGPAPQTLQTAFKPDPNAMNYSMSPAGEVSLAPGPVPAGSAKLPPDKGPTLLGEQARAKVRTAGAYTFDQIKNLATLTGNPKKFDGLIATAEKEGRDTVSKDELGQAYKSMSAGAAEERGKSFTTRAAVASLQDLPSMAAQTTAPGAAYQVKVASRQGKSIIAKATTPQAILLASSDLGRAVQRSAPLAETIGAASFGNNLTTKWNQLKQKITSDPTSTDIPKIRKELYQMFDELDKASEPWISNHMAARKEKGIDDSPDELKRQLGQNIPDIPFDDGSGNIQGGSNHPAVGGMFNGKRITKVEPLP